MLHWYLGYRLSLRDLVEMMSERGLSLAHTTIMCWVNRFTPEFVKRENRVATEASRWWRDDEIYVKIRGKWAYLYRAVDRAGKTVDSRLGSRCDVAAAKAFFTKTIKRQGLAPKTITLDGYAASHRAVREMKIDKLLPDGATLRSSKYLDNLIEQDHCNLKARVNVTFSFKPFRTALTTISGIKLMHRIRKGQFNLMKLHLKISLRPRFGRRSSQLAEMTKSRTASRSPALFAPQPLNRSVEIPIALITSQLKISE